MPSSAGRLEDHPKPHVEPGPALRAASSAQGDQLQHRVLPARLRGPGTDGASDRRCVVPNTKASPSSLQTSSTPSLPRPPYRQAGWHSRYAPLHRQERLGSAHRLCLASLRQRQDRPARRLGTLHRNSARLLARLRMGRLRQLRRRLQPGFQSDGVTPQLSFSNPFPPQTPGSATAPPASTTPSPSTTKTPPSSSGIYDRRAGPRPRHRACASPTPAATAQSRNHGRPQPGPNTVGYYNNSTTGLPLCQRPDGSYDESPTIARIPAGASSRASRTSLKATTTAAPSKSRATAAKASPSTPATCSPATLERRRSHAQRLRKSPAATSSPIASTPGLDYGNVSYDRKHRFLVTYLYDLPFGKGQRWLNTGSALNASSATGISAASPFCRAARSSRPIRKPPTRPTPTSSPPSARRARTSSLANRSTPPSQRQPVAQPERLRHSRH
jgi:hypothetical protein